MYKRNSFSPFRILVFSKYISLYEEKQSSLEGTVYGMVVSNDKNLNPLSANPTKW